MHLELKKLIYDRCMSLRQFSKLSGLPYNTVYALANNQRPCASLLTIEKLCKCLNCNVEELIKLD